MEGRDEVVATGVGTTGVGENGVEAEVVAINGIPDGWTVQQSRNARRRSPRNTQDRMGVGSSVSPVRKKRRLARRQASPNCFEALSPIGQGDVEGDVGPEVQVESPNVARRSQRRAQVQRASHVGLDAIAEAVTTLDREQEVRQLRLTKPGRRRNLRGESTSAGEDSDEGDTGVECTQVREAEANMRTARLLTELSKMPGRAIDGDTSEEVVGVSSEDEERFSDAVADPGRRRAGAARTAR